jgi:hypothetical protein
MDIEWKCMGRASFLVHACMEQNVNDSNGPASPLPVVTYTASMKISVAYKNYLKCFLNFMG